MASRAVIAGVTGVMGSNLAEHLGFKGCEVYGVARKPEAGVRGVRSGPAEHQPRGGRIDSRAAGGPAQRTRAGSDPQPRLAGHGRMGVSSCRRARP